MALRSVKYLTFYAHIYVSGAKIPHINVIITVEEKELTTPQGEKTIDLAGR